MPIGVPREIRTNENRAALIPAGTEARMGGELPLLTPTSEVAGRVAMKQQAFGLDLTRVQQVIAHQETYVPQPA